MRAIPSLSYLCRALLALQCALLTACGPLPLPAPTATPQPSPAPTATPQPTRRPAVTAAPRPTTKPGALSLWAVVPDGQRDQLRRTLLAIGGQAGVDITVTPKTPDQLQTDIRAYALAGLPQPDLIWGSQQDLGALQREQFIQPAADGLSPEAFLPATLRGSTLEDQRWGTPVGAQGYLLLLFNTQLANSAPATTDDLISRSRALERSDRYGLVAAWAEPRWFLALLNGFGGEPISQDGAITLDSQPMVKALNLLRELRVAGPPPPSSYDEGASLFSEGRAAFALDGDWSLDGYRQFTDTLSLGLAPMPLVPATGRVAAGPLDGVYLMYGRALSGSDLARAYTLGRALAGPEAQSQLARDLALLPALSAALADPAVRENPQLAAAAAAAPTADGLPPNRALRCAWDAIAAALPAVLLGEVPQERAATQMQSAAMACLSQPEASN